MGRKCRTPDGPAKPRPGVPMTDAEYAPVLEYAEKEGIRPVEAVRRLIVLGLAVQKGRTC